MRYLIMENKMTNQLRREYLKEIFDFINKFEEDYPVEYPKSQTKEERALKQKIYFNTFKGRMLKRLKDMRRYLKKKRLKENFTKEEWINKIEKTEGICPSCKKFVGKLNLEMDHIIPISKAPLDFIYTINDIQPLCKKCNVSKGNRPSFFNKQNI